MTRQDIGAILMKLREDAGKSREEVAELLGKSAKTIGHWETGYAQPDANTLFLLCTIYDADINTSFGFNSKEKKAPRYSSEAMKLAKDYDDRMDIRGRETVRAIADFEIARKLREGKAALQKQWKQEKAAEEIEPRVVEKLVYRNPAAAGAPLYAESEFDRLEFPENEVPLKADFGIRISGQSMEPTVMDRSIVWVHKTPELENGAVGVFMLNDSAVCKRFYKNNDGTVRLESDNPKFPPVPVTEFDMFIPIGEVVGTV